MFPAFLFIEISRGRAQKGSVLEKSIYAKAIAGTSRFIFEKKSPGFLKKLAKPAR